MKVQEIFLVIFISFLLIATHCEKAVNAEFPLIIDNNSSFNIAVYFNENEQYQALYPDTVISNFRERVILNINKKENQDIAGSPNWESTFEVSAPKDTLSLFVFHSDTVNEYSWEKIRKEYKILTRYDLSLQDLENRNFILEYPYDPSLGKLKIWPKK